MANACGDGSQKEQEPNKFRANGYDLSQDPEQRWPMELQFCENVEMNGVEFNPFRMVDLRFRHMPGFPPLEVHRILFVNEQNRHPNVWLCYTGKLHPSEVPSVISDPMSPAFTPIVNSPCSSLPTVLKQGGFKDGEGHIFRDNSDYVFWRYVELHILGLDPWWKQRLDCMSFNLSTLHNIEKGSPRHSFLQMCHTIRSGKPESQLVAMQITCWHKNANVESTRTETMIFVAGFQKLLGMKRAVEMDINLTDMELGMVKKEGFAVARSMHQLPAGTQVDLFDDEAVLEWWMKELETEISMQHALPGVIEEVNRQTATEHDADNSGRGQASQENEDVEMDM